MQKAQGKIGIFGGTFNPVHHGHLIAARTILEDFCLDRMIFIPTRFPPHKKGEEITGALHRYEMISKAISGHPGFEVSSMELDREGTTYTVDTLEELRRHYGEDTKLFFMIGADVVHDLKTWKDFQRVFTLCEFIAVLRPGFDKNSFQDAICHLQSEYGAKIHTAVIPQMEISSTLVRERVQASKNVRYLVPESVEAYMAENGLYRSEGTI